MGAVVRGVAPSAKVDARRRLARRVQATIDRTRHSPEASEEAAVRERQGNEIVPSGDPAQQDDPPQPKATHGNPNVHAHSSPEALERRESGQPGGGAGRRDDVGRSGVYPISGDERPSGDAELRPLGYWLAGDRDKGLAPSWT